MNRQFFNQSDISSDIQFSELTKVLPDGILISDQNGSIRFINDQVLEIFKYKKDELIGQKVEKLIPRKFHTHHAAQRRNYFETPKKLLMSHRDVLYGQRSDGSNVSVEISLNPYVHEGEKYVITVIRDTSTRKHIELLESKNRELEQFAYIASHDLQEPLRSIRGLLELLSKECAHQIDGEALKYLDLISAAGDRMSSLISGLLDYVRLGFEKKISRVDVNLLMEHILKDLSVLISEANADIAYEALPTVNAYEPLLRLVFQNIINNAIKFRKVDVPPKIIVSCKRKDDFWEFCIRDNGIGIDEAHVSKIFDIFKRVHNRSKYEGTGIGLSHAKKIIELHGGKIWVESKVDKGSKFCFTIPS
jgi:PAS domain S-box-containing protein